MTKYEIWIKDLEDGEFHCYTTFEMKEPAYDYVEILRSHGRICFINEHYEEKRGDLAR